ncbi:MAG: hypothetical protein IPJ26_14845 [Bacteroidetes bacterium]|nr:hypothetical protein [Bacteroidota bacterium]
MQGIRHLSMTYQLKEGTSTSYYFKDGDQDYLPKRLCITPHEFAPVFGLPKQRAGQIKGTFTIAESSIYKEIAKSIHSTIFAPIKPKPSIIGTGDIRGTKDLLVFQSNDEWSTFTIHLFIGGLFYESTLIDEL